jgi:glycosyltransferase involved in cell wall biosynthesis
MGRPTVSIIMNCKNGAAYLTETLNSVFAQTYTDWEVIFWDDASTDCSAAIARSFGEHVRYFKGPGEQPLGQSRNLAFGQAEGRFLAILDTDDTWAPSKLMRQVEFLEKHDEIGLLATDCWHIDGSGATIGRHFATFPFPDGDPYRQLLAGRNFLASPTLMMRKDLAWCRTDFHFAELYELGVRIARWGRMAALPEPLASYRFHRHNRGGSGCVGMTKEVLVVMKQHRHGASMGQWVREAVLRARLGWQTLAHS